MCSPSRSTFFTGLYPEQHGVTDTLSFGGTASVDQPELPLDIQNMAKLLKSAGYAVQYRGKWHMSKGADGNDPTPADLANYGFDGWVPPDAGEDANPDHFGGGCPNNDQHYIDQAIQFLQSPAAGGAQPWALVVSLVNPHDVLSYAQTWASQASDGSDCYNYRFQAPGCFEQGISLPPTYGENLRRNFKPTAHFQTLELLAAGLGPLLPALHQPENYVNFYAYLQNFTDVQIGQLLDALDARPARQDRHLPLLRPRRARPLARRPAPEDVQRLRGDAQRAPRRQQPRPLPAARADRRPGLARGPDAHPRHAGQGARARPVGLQGRRPDAGHPRRQPAPRQSDRDGAGRRPLYL